MNKNLNVQINTQPDLTSCGPTSLHAVYSYYNDEISLSQTIGEINQFEDGGGTIAAILGKHALRRGYKATIISYNINIFDPTWFKLDEIKIIEKLKMCILEEENSRKHTFSIEQYIDFLNLGGKLKFEDLSPKLLISILKNNVPILTGLSSTWLYGDIRENASTNEDDDISGEPAGHFIVIDGYNEKGQFDICDPYHKNPITKANHYSIDGFRLINSILLGISSYDGNLLLIEQEK